MKLNYNISKGCVVYFFFYVEYKELLFSLTDTDRNTMVVPEKMQNNVIHRCNTYFMRIIIIELKWNLKMIKFWLFSFLTHNTKFIILLTDTGDDAMTKHYMQKENYHLGGIYFISLLLSWGEVDKGYDKKKIKEEEESHYFMVMIHRILMYFIGDSDISGM